MAKWSFAYQNFIFILLFLPPPQVSHDNNTHTRGIPLLSLLGLPFSSLVGGSGCDGEDGGGAVTPVRKGHPPPSLFPFHLLSVCVCVARKRDGRVGFVMAGGPFVFPASNPVNLGLIRAL